MDKEITKRLQLDYLLHLPAGYGESDHKWPLILFLHGRGERGSDLNLLKKYGIPKLVEEQDDFPFITVSPQCPDTTLWSQENELLHALLDDIIANYAVDENRIYVTGISMGGFGTWNVAAANPGRFAAIAPISSTGPTDKLHLLKDVPVWVSHGGKDTTVPVEQAEALIEAHRAVGGNPKLTIYPEGGHADLVCAFTEMELYEWFLKHSLAK
ncbi:phospholipase [Paenibacillus sp. LMG 31456]|uniref:Phospholipase n=2 Tax=Paenibacillus foliorum TaxID=2654974 RepID=A0A972GRC0_9BACL|nr:phospholipase [Paenibacillus foliorum]